MNFPDRAPEAEWNACARCFSSSPRREKIALILLRFLQTLLGVPKILLDYAGHLCGSNFGISRCEMLDLDDIAERHATRPLPALLGPRSFLGEEDIAAYLALAARVREAVHPGDVFEEFWARDIVDLVWERLRWSRLRDELLDGSLNQGVRLILREMLHPHDADLLHLQWCAQQPQAVAEVKRLLERLPPNALGAHTLASRLDEIERIDFIAMRCEQRRNIALREIARHREAFADRLRDVARQIENPDEED